MLNVRQVIIYWKVGYWLQNSMMACKLIVPQGHHLLHVIMALEYNTIISMFKVELLCKKKNTCIYHRFYLNFKKSFDFFYLL